jgi:hypothetical protein
MTNALGRQAARAADDLHAVLTRSDVPPETATAINEAVNGLGRAEDAFDPGVGPPDVEAGNAAFREVRVILEPLEIAVPFMDQTLRAAIQAALVVARRSA